MEKKDKIVDRSFDFAVRIIKLCQYLSARDRINSVLCGQLLRCGTSIGANVEEAQAAQSKADFIAKMSIARKEARETCYWLRLMVASELVELNLLESILQESEEIISILTAIVKTAQQRQGK